VLLSLLREELKDARLNSIVESMLPDESMDSNVPILVGDLLSLDRGLWMGAERLFIFFTLATVGGCKISDSP
jgi:hypothetical protein